MGKPHPTASLVDRQDLSLASERVTLAPGELRLVSDHFDLNSGEFTRKQDWVAYLLSKVQTEIPYSVTDPSSISASVDATVFAADKCVGPDHYRVCARFQTELDAERDVAEELLRLLDSNAPEADVVAYLKGLTDASAEASASLSGAAFDRAFYRGRQAQALQALYKRGGIEGVMQRSWRVTQRPRRTLSPLTSQ
jgi:hypothetical protein